MLSGFIPIWELQYDLVKVTVVWIIHVNLWNNYFYHFVYYFCSLWQQTQTSSAMITSLFQWLPSCVINQPCTQLRRAGRLTPNKTASKRRNRSYSIVKRYTVLIDNDSNSYELSANHLRIRWTEFYLLTNLMQDSTDSFPQFGQCQIKKVGVNKE